MKIKLDKTPWAVVSTVIVAIMVLPLIGVLFSFIQPSDQWSFIRDNLLFTYLKDSAILVIGSVGLGIVIASALAWYVTAYEFPGRRFLMFALILPLAIPPYIAGYTYVAMFDFTGIVQEICRNWLGWNPPPGFFHIQTMPGAIIIFALFLYPYIYLVLRAFLDRQAQQLIEASSMLGASRIRTYWKVVFPLTRNALIAGATLMTFEVLSDYGLVSYFGLQVFTTAVFRAWLQFRDLTAALRLAGILLLLVTFVSFAEKMLRGQRSYSYGSGRPTPLRRQKIQGFHRLWVLFVCWFVLAWGLIIPLVQMLYWAWIYLPVIRKNELPEAFVTSFGLAFAGATITTLAALVISQYQRLWPSWWSRTTARLTVMGYSVPSTVIAISILMIAVSISQRIGVNLMATPAIVVLAYVIRYLAVSMQSVESGLERVGMRFHESSRMLRRGAIATTLRVDIPMIRTAIIGGFLLAFMDMVKELPLVLILRPFNLETLSARVFRYSHDEMIPQSSLASLLIVLLALIPLVVVHFINLRQESTEATNVH